uniref:Coat protein n=1 Tax=Strawberry vein banding virus TaxID=47903 RepID=A0A7D5DKT8_9VIRU|nr:capsid protein [Strawberry vein banding virus]UCJ01209.1 coat protein [Strawberry vein banding virus]
MSSRRERLEQLFEEDHPEMDTIIQYLSLLDDELDNCQEEKLQVLVAKEMISYSSSSEDEAANVKANIKEEDEDTYRPNRKRRGTSSSQPNYTRYDIPSEYIPNKKTGLTNTKSLDLDCASNRRQLIEEWDNEMRLIIKTEKALTNDFDLILTLAKSKTVGNAKQLLESLHTDAFKQASSTGEEFLTTLTNSFYTIFVGTNYLTQGTREKEKAVQEARNRLVKLQICNLCSLESFFCDYETNLLKLPIEEWPKYIEEYIRKIPFVGMEVLEEYSKQDNITKGSLGYAHNLIKAYMEKKCKSLKIKKEIRRNMCCPKFSSPETQYGCKPISHKKAKKKKYKQYYKRKYRLRKPKRWTNSRRKYSGRKLFRRKRDQKEETAQPSEGKKKFCPQGKTSCRCWICNEIGHFAKDCRNKTANHNKVLEELKTLQLEPVFDTSRLEEEEMFWEIISETDSESESESSSDESDDSTDLE